MINVSLWEGVFIGSLKQALDKDTYRPVTNLNFRSKKEHCPQIKSCIQQFNIDNRFQSAYRVYIPQITLLSDVFNMIDHIVYWTDSMSGLTVVVVHQNG